MNHSLRIVSLIAAVAVSCWVLGWGRPTSAQPESSLLVEPSPAAEQPELVPAMPTPPQATTPQPLPTTWPQQQAQEEMAPPEGAVPASAVTVHPVERIDYDVTRRARRMFGGSPFVELSMVTQNPADGCLYEIPMCLPACCTGEPKMTSYCGLFGRGVVKYCYECGLEVEVKFRLRGDVEVEYGT
jgi:hypothetical protein